MVCVFVEGDDTDAHQPVLSQRDSAHDDMSVQTAGTVGWLTAIVAVSLFVLAFVLPIWALRKHNRLFPKGWDRTG